EGVWGLGQSQVPAKFWKRVFKVIDRAAVKLFCRHEFIAWPHQTVHDDDLGGMARGNRQTRGAAFERGDALFQHRVGRIADARIDVAEGLQAEQRSRVVDVLEHE